MSTTKPARNDLLTLADVLDAQTLDTIRRVLPDENAAATLAALGTPKRGREPRDDDARLIQALQRVAWFAVLHASMGRRDGGEAAERAEAVRDAHRNLKAAEEELQRIARMRGFPPPEVWRGRDWARLADWFATEGTRETPDAHPPPRHPARRWATVRVLALYEVATKRKAGPGPKESIGPCCRFVHEWRNGLREAMATLADEASAFADTATDLAQATKAREGAEAARHAAEVIAPNVKPRSLWDEVAEGVAAMDAADAASSPLSVARGVMTPRLEAKTGWIGGGELSVKSE